MKNQASSKEQKNNSHLVTVEPSQFVLSPSLKKRHWCLSTKDKLDRNIDSLEVDFSTNTPHHRDQQAILEIAIEDNDWSFSQEGIQYKSGCTDHDHYIKVEVSQDAKTLTLILNYPDTKEEVNFNFIAKHLNQESGQITFCESSDPVVIIGGIKD